jgi:carboxypeptidase Q
LLNKNEKYFWYHHSDGDTMNVWESKDTLDKCAALWAAASYVIADLSVDMPRTLKNGDRK